MRSEIQDSGVLKFLMVGINERIDIPKCERVDLVMFDFGIQRSHLQVKQFRSLHLMAARLKQRPANQINLETTDLVVKVETALDG